MATCLSPHCYGIASQGGNDLVSYLAYNLPWRWCCLPQEPLQEGTAVTLKELLSQKIGRHQREGEGFAKKLQQQIRGLPSEMKGTRIRIEVEAPKDVPNSSYHFAVDLKNLYRGVCVAKLLQSAALSKQAQDDIRNGRLVKALEHYVMAERYLGAADMLLHKDLLSSVEAMIKAGMRHSKTDSIRRDAIKYYRKQINPQVSAQEAAERMYGKVIWPHGVEVSIRILAKWISAEKKKAKTDLVTRSK
jgi:hypothetical protein